MPTYHFRCPSCNTETELKLSFGSKEKPNCKKCKKEMTKIMRPPMVHFKGSGFYKTDSAKKETKHEPKKEAPTPKVEPKPSAPPPNV